MASMLDNRNRNLVLHMTVFPGMLA